MGKIFTTKDLDVVPQVLRSPLPNLDFLPIELLFDQLRSNIQIWTDLNNYKNCLNDYLEFANIGKDGR